MAAASGRRTGGLTFVPTRHIAHLHMLIIARRGCLGVDQSSGVVDITSLTCVLPSFPSSCQWRQGVGHIVPGANAALLHIYRGRGSSCDFIQTLLCGTHSTIAATTAHHHPLSLHCRRSARIAEQNPRIRSQTSQAFQMPPKLDGDPVQTSSRCLRKDVGLGMKKTNEACNQA